jgi:uncharacterized protein
MKIALIGASGFVGRHILTEALQRNHQVTAVVRNPGKITVKNEQLAIKKADAFDVGALAAIIAGHDAVISAYNAGWENPALYEDFISGAKAIQESVKKAGVKRLLVVGGAGSLEVAPGVQLVDTPQFPQEYKKGATAARDYLNVLKTEKELEWTFISPAILMHPGITDGRTGIYRIGKDQPVVDNSGESRISVEDLSVAILDEVANKKFIRQRFTVAY